jgi:hypothetical protein
VRCRGDMSVDYTIIIHGILILCSILSDCIPMSPCSTKNSSKVVERGGDGLAPMNAPLCGSQPQQQECILLRLD